MPCCKILIALTIIAVIIAAWVFIYLYINNFRIKYFDLKMLFSGRKKPVEVGRYYDNFFESYNTVYGDTIQSYRSEHIAQLHAYILNSAGLKDGMKVLDAGCGVCGPAIYFAQNCNITIEAVTISEKQAALAKQKISDNNLSDKINVKCADYHLLDKIFPENTFDLVLFLESYGHAQNHTKLLRASAKVLKKGGYIYIKDYFKKDMPKKLLQRQLIKMGTKNMDNIYRYNTPDLYHTIYIMRHLNFDLIRMQIPQVPEWDKNRVIQEFHVQNNIDFYNSKDALFDQNNGRFIVDPYEMLFVKK